MADAPVNVPVQVVFAHDFQSALEGTLGLRTVAQFPRYTILGTNLGNNFSVEARLLEEHSATVTHPDENDV